MRASRKTWVAGHGSSFEVNSAARSREYGVFDTPRFAMQLSICLTQIASFTDRKVGEHWLSFAVASYFLGPHKDSNFSNSIL